MRQSNLFRFSGLLLCIFFATVLHMPIYAAELTTPTGWRLTFDNTDTINPQVQLQIPESVKLAVLTADNTYVQGSSFTLFKTRRIDQTTLSGEDNRVQYQIELAGISFFGEGITFDGQYLYLKKIWSETPDHFWYNLLGEEFDANKRFTFSNVQITSGGAISGAYSDPKTSCALYSYWAIKIRDICLDHRGLSANGTVYLNCNFKTIQPGVTVFLDSDLIPRSGEIQQAFPYDIGKNGQLIIEEAELVFEWLTDLEGKIIPADSLVFVRKAKYLLTEMEIAEVEVEFGNFTIDDQLVILEKAGGFYTKPIPFTIDGVPYVFADYSVKTGSSGIWGWVEVETSPDYIPAQ